jgi:uncharacterized membrane protein YkvA (DUF1232 family)
MNLKQTVKELISKVSALYLALKRKDTPLIAKIAAGIAVGYALSPIDLIPDFIPILGYLDDILLLPLLIRVSIKLMPKPIMEECESQAAGLWEKGRPKKWHYAIPVIAIWAIVIGLIVYKIFVRDYNGISWYGKRLEF